MRNLSVKKTLLSTLNRQIRSVGELGLFIVLLLREENQVSWQGFVVRRYCKSAILARPFLASPALSVKVTMGQ